MSQQRLVLDSLEFARQHKQVSGRIDPALLGRLAGVLLDNTGGLEFTVAGSSVQATSGAEHSLSISLNGALNLVCQRCLGSLQWPLRIHSRLVLIEAGAVWPDDDLLDDGSDPIDATPALDVLALIEDELLLALPIAPMHGNCRAGAVSVADVASPFAKLAGLKPRR